MKSWKKFGVIASLLVIAVLFLSACTSENQYTEQQFKDAKEAAKNEGITLGKESVDVSSNDADVAKEAVDKYKEDVEANETPVVFETQTSSANEAVCEPYTIDDLKLGDSVSKTADDNDFCKLKDDRVAFNGEDFDYKETIQFTSDVKVAYSGSSEFEKDFEGTPRLVLTSTGAVSYNLKFEDLPTWKDVDDNEPLDVDFLGQTLTIVRADAEANEIVISNGKSANLVLGQTLEGVKLEAVAEDKVLVSYQGKVFTVPNNGARYVAPNVRVRAEVFDEGQSAYLTVGANARKTITDGDEYFGEDKNDATWVWKVDLENGVLGIVHDKSLDTNEEALKVDQSFDLPNNYARVTFKQLSSEKSEDYSFNVEKVDISGVSTKVLLIKGKLVYGSDEADAKRGIAVRGDKFYAYDSNTRNWEETTDVRFEVNNNPLMVRVEDDVSVLSFDNIFLAFNPDSAENEEFVALYYGERNLENHEEDLLTKEGYVIKTPEDHYENGRLELKGVPKDEPEFGVVVSNIPVSA